MKPALCLLSVGILFLILGQIMHAQNVNIVLTATGIELGQAAPNREVISDLSQLTIRKDYLQLTGLCFGVAALAALAVRLSSLKGSELPWVNALGEMMLYGMVAGTASGYLWDTNAIEVSGALAIACVIGVAAGYLGKDISKVAVTVSLRILGAFVPGIGDIPDPRSREQRKSDTKTKKLQD